MGAQNIPSDLNRKIQRNIVAADSSVVTVTALAASSGLPPICAAMLKDATAVGVANMEMSTANSGPRSPASAA